MTAASMAATPDPLQQRYEAIERVYSERRWDDVARRSEELLLELPDDPGHPLRQRLQLLLGHTYLYGYQDAVTASGFYSRVQAATQEPVLVEIATLGLQQCSSQTVTPPPTPEPAPAEARPVALPAMPWMEQLGGIDPAAPSTLPELAVELPQLAVEVIEEPELIEVAVSQELPAAVQELPAEPINKLSPEEMAELSKGLLRVVIR
ncbi:hypothetical protein KBY65_03425 [Cyanobium sp. Alchichica 3B3-8F6]|uniref:hypothetical protein n=1 Tax=Cyanobium sp. Alchichica 3B3-8F6 TaxID=2823696 RepID=UPI0020CE942C|nr:hypothetical protein [Cyanobium sp. Alchichica 3B3-8F6]MCP9881532.1 hypothetical protein [Cyanobium sp. Alchichica 3B3-8F6]